MKKIYIFCFFIILVGIFLNAYLYYDKSITKIEPKKNNNIISNTNCLLRPIAFMINNISEALPQSGIYGADYVYEMLVEGGITRLMTIYTKNIPERIGPIRSARHNFLDISMEYDAVYAHFGGSPKAFSDIKALGIPNLNGIALDGKMYWRDESRKAPHNAYTNIEKTLEYMKKFGYDRVVLVNHFNFAQNEVILNGKSAQKVHIPYSFSYFVDYEYNENSKDYKRFMKGKPQIDEAKKLQMSAKNIIIEFAKNTSMDDENRQEIYLVGSGKGYFITNGKYIDITWQKSKRNEKTVYYNEKGEEITLNVGQTWIQIIPIEAKVEIK